MAKSNIRSLQFFVYLFSGWKWFNFYLFSALVVRKQGLFNHAVVSIRNAEEINRRRNKVLILCFDTTLYLISVKKFMS